MSKCAAIAMCLLLASCGWRSPNDFREKGAGVSDSGMDAGEDATSPLADLIEDNDAAPPVEDVSVPDDLSTGPPTFTTLTSNSVTNAASADTAAITHDGMVLLWIVTFSAAGTPNIPIVTGFELVERQVAGNRRQIVLMRGEAGGALTIDLTGQQQDTIIWVAVGSNLGSVTSTATFQSNGDSASVPLAGVDSDSQGVTGGFIVGGNVTPTPDTGLQDTGSGCGGGACLFTVAGPGPRTSAGLAWGSAAPWIGTAAALAP